MAKELYVDGALYLVLDGDRQLEPGVGGTLRETFSGPAVGEGFGRLVNHMREDPTVRSVEVRER